MGRAQTTRMPHPSSITLRNPFRECKDASKTRTLRLADRRWADAVHHVVFRQSLELGASRTLVGVGLNARPISPNDECQPSRNHVSQIRTTEFLDGETWGCMSS